MNCYKYENIRQKNHLWKSSDIFFTRFVSIPRCIIFSSSYPLFFDCLKISLNAFYSSLYFNTSSVICSVWLVFIFQSYLLSSSNSFNLFSQNFFNSTKFLSAKALKCFLASSVLIWLSMQSLSFSALNSTILSLTS